MQKIVQTLRKFTFFGIGIIGSFFLMAPSLSLAAKVPQEIIISYLEDKALYRAHEGASWEALKSGQTLFPNYEIKTLAETRLTLRLGDGSEVRVAPNSHLRINHQTDSEVGNFDFQLMLGKAWAKFRKNVKLGAKLILRTAHATINIQGTSYEASIAGDQTQVHVFTGKVAVSNQSNAAHQGASAPTEIAPPHEVSREQWHLIVSAFYTVSVTKNQRPDKPKPFHLNSVENDWVTWNLNHDKKLSDAL